MSGKIPQAEKEYQETGGLEKKTLHTQNSENCIATLKTWGNKGRGTVAVAVVRHARVN